LDTYKQCPKKYKFQQIDKIKIPKTKEAVFGTLVHESLKFMFSRDPLFPTLEEVLASFREKLAESPIKNEDKERYGEAGMEMLRKFWKKNPPWNFNVIDTESRFEVTLDDNTNKTTHVLAGIIDRIDTPSESTYEVIDYKTSRKLPSQKYVDEDLQLSLYHLAITKRWPHTDPDYIILSLYYLKAGEKLSTKRSGGALKTTEEKVLEKIHAIEEKIKSDDFPPKPSALCNWCGYRPICPAWKHLYQKKKDASPQDIEIERVIDDFLELKQKSEEDKKKIAELADKINVYMDLEKVERLFGKKNIISRSIQERTEWSIDEVKEILQPLGLWEEILSADIKKLNALFSKLPAQTRKKLQEKAIKLKRFTALKVLKKKVSPPDE